MVVQQRTGHPAVHHLYWKWRNADWQDVEAPMMMQQWWQQVQQKWQLQQLRARQQQQAQQHQLQHPQHVRIHVQQPRPTQQGMQLHHVPEGQLHAAPQLSQPHKRKSGDGKTATEPAHVPDSHDAGADAHRKKMQRRDPAANQARQPSGSGSLQRAEGGSWKFKGGSLQEGSIVMAQVLNMPEAWPAKVCLLIQSVTTHVGKQSENSIWFRVLHVS